MVVDDAEATFTVDEDVIMEFVRNVYEKKVVRENIDADLWNEYVRIFKAAVNNGYKQSSNTEFDRKGRLAQQIEHNIEVFSAFKVHNEQELMASKMLDSEGKMVGFEEFKKNTESIIKHHNESWLQTEYSTASLRASQAADWQEFVANSDIFPNLKWMPTTSAHPDEVVHGKYSGLTHEMPQVILPVDDKFWNNHRPGDRWNCKCSLEPTDEPSLHETNKRAAKLAQAGKATGQRGLQANPGIDGEIIDDSHPYFPKDCAHCDFFKFKGSTLVNKNKDCLHCKYARGCYEGEIEKSKVFQARQKAINSTLKEATFSYGDEFRTGVLKQYQHSMRSLVKHCYTTDEVAAAVYIWKHPHDMEFVTVSPLGENKDLSNPKDVKNVEKKQRKGIEEFFKYKFTYKDKTYYVKTAHFVLRNKRGMIKKEYEAFYAMTL